MLILASRQALVVLYKWWWAFHERSLLVRWQHDCELNKAYDFRVYLCGNIALCKSLQKDFYNLALRCKHTFIHATMLWIEFPRESGCKKCNCWFLHKQGNELHCGSFVVFVVLTGDFKFMKKSNNLYWSLGSTSSEFMWTWSPDVHLATRFCSLLVLIIGLIC